MSRQAFSRQLARLNRQHLGTSKRVNDTILKIVANGVPETAFRIAGINGEPVYKLRIRIGHHGSRACRLVFYYKEGTVEPLLIYQKSDKEDAAPAEIIAALRAADLLPPPRPSGPQSEL
ncbi:MAG: hypothetical protein OXQ84_12085 [bacterium]|nr:hypothetical protein [bacterium]